MTNLLVQLVLFLLVSSSAFAVGKANRGSRSRGRNLQQTENDLFFSVTYRDFIGSACFYIEKAGGQNRNETLVNIQVEAWNITGKSNEISRTFLCFKYEKNARFFRQLNQGIISGHPDFEALGQRKDQEECKEGRSSTEGGTPVNFPVSTCIFEKGPEFSIIQENLRIGENGLAKPVYCDESSSTDISKCGVVTKDDDGIVTEISQTMKQYFDLWYNDDLKYNKRIGQRLKLSKVGETNVFLFDSGSDDKDNKRNGTNDAPDFGEDPNLQHFGPLSRFTIGPQKLNIDKIKVPREAPAWPRAIILNDLDTKSFYFTTELHTFFEFRRDADMIFTFTGDDDFWAFINNKMVIDLGGVHPARNAKIDLNSDFDGNFNVSEFLGLEDGGVYSLDIFHAERQTSASTFQMTTTLFAACNVQQSGTRAIDISSVEPAEVNIERDFVLHSSVDYDAENKTFTIQKENQPFSTSFLFTRRKENVGRGFIADFDVSVEGAAEGFAFVVQAQGTDDYPVRTGPHFNLDEVTKSFAVVFDLCNNRDEISSPDECSDQKVSVHYPELSDEPNEFSNVTEKTRDFIARKLTTGEVFPVQVIHYGGKPNFLEVYVNGSLYLRENNFDITDIIDGTGAHVGFTASSGIFSSNIKIKNFVLNTVEVEPISTRFIAEDAEVARVLQATDEELLQTVVADGEDLSDGYTIRTADFCNNQLDSGSLDSLISALYIELRNTTGVYGRGSLNASIEEAVKIDNEDGTYTLSLETENPGTYMLAVAFGEGCSVKIESEFKLFNISNQFLEVDRIIPLEDVFDVEVLVQLPTPVLDGDADFCFFEIFSNGSAVVEALQLVRNETIVDPNAGKDDTAGPVILFASIAGGIFCLGFIAAAVLVAYRKKWNRDKVYVPTGELYRTEMDTKFDMIGEYSTTTTALMKTQQEILDLRSQEPIVNPHAAAISDLQLQNLALKEQIREKKAAIEDGVAPGDVNNAEYDEPESELVAKLPPKMEF